MIAPLMRLAAETAKQQPTLWKKMLDTCAIAIAGAFGAGAGGTAWQETSKRLRTQRQTSARRRKSRRQYAR